MSLDNLNIVYKMNEEKTIVTVLKVIWTDNSQPKEKLRTKEWLLKISEILDFDSPNPITEEKAEAIDNTEEVK